MERDFLAMEILGQTSDMDAIEAHGVLGDVNDVVMKSADEYKQDDR